MLKELNIRCFKLAALSTCVGIFGSALVNADALTDAIKNGKVNADIRVRYENVNKDGASPSSGDGMAIRTRMGYTTASYNGLSAMLEFEDVRDMFAIQDEGGFIPDNEVTELEQGFLQYKTKVVTAKLGRQVIALDGHRHIGHVGWRQDRQTFDAARVMFKPIDNLNVDLAYIYRRNGVNGSVLDTSNPDYKSINVSYKTSVGKISAYSYLLTKEGGLDETNTYGASFTGKTVGDISFLYAFEYATQDNKTKNVDTEYTLVEAGVSVAGITGKLGYEVLGSDTNNGVTENFSTPMATVHKFQGWADVFLGGSVTGTIDGGNGIVDTNLSLGTKLAGIKLLAVYHDYESDADSTDLGNEINLLAAKKFGKHYSVGLKYADYSKGDTGADIDKFWAWVGMSF